MSDGARSQAAGARVGPALTMARFPGSSFVRAMAMARDHEAFLAARASAEDPFLIDMPGMAPTWTTGSPDGAREIFSAPRDTFAPALPNPIEPLLGPASLILLEGERHQRERKLLLPAFTGARMRAAATVVQQATLREVDRWTPGAVLDALECAQHVTLDVIIEAVFGVRDPARQETFRTAILRLLGCYSPPLMLLPSLRRAFGGYGPWARFQRARREFDLLLDEEIERRRELPDQGDTLSLLLAIRDQAGEPLAHSDVKDQLRTLLVAGHETSAVGIGWALHFALAAPEVQRLVMRELDSLGPAPTAEALLGLPYLRALCDEALRLHPVVPIALRRVVAPFTLRARPIAPGDNVAVAITVLHANRSIWNDPERFRPERFLERSFSPHEYAPYGGGSRRCIGAAFAQQEMQVVVGTILGNARLATSDGKSPRPSLRNIIAAPKGGIPVRYLGRREATSRDGA